MINVGGFDTTVGVSGKAFKSWARDGPLVRLLKDSGAVPYVKTNIPITLLSYESSNDVWGRTTHPKNAEYTPGGSSGGEAALLALGGGRIGIGSDVAGSVRIPAHFSGIYSLKCSTGRWLKLGMDSTGPGQEGIASVLSPMAGSLEDLRYFTKAIIDMKPWDYDHSVHPLPWRGEIEREVGTSGSLRIGIMETDGKHSDSRYVSLLG
jgi:Asp-tRNA(Asn)/Glu-tRNA(Gln) amidotransferase A subunit family amidase